MFGPAHPRAPHSEDLDTQVLERDETLPGFGPFGTFDTHAFDPASPAYRRIAALVRDAGRGTPCCASDASTSGRSACFGDFALPAAGELIAWSRILDTDEAVVIVNPNGDGARGGQVVVAGELSRVGDEFLVVVNTAEAGAAAGHVHRPAPGRIARRRPRPALRRRADLRRDRSAAAGGSPGPGEDSLLMPAAPDPFIARRMRAQRLSAPMAADPAAVVAWFGAVQAQDYPGAKWALTLRAPALTDAQLDQALADGTIIRTHGPRPDLALHRAGRRPLGAHGGGAARPAAVAHHVPDLRDRRRADDPRPPDRREGARRRPVRDARRDRQGACREGHRGRPAIRLGLIMFVPRAGPGRVQRSAPGQAVHLRAVRRARPRRAGAAPPRTRARRWPRATWPATGR